MWHICNGQEWKVEIDECEAGGPYEMEIQCGDENIKFQDILIRRSMALQAVSLIWNWNLRIAITE